MSMTVSRGLQFKGHFFKIFKTHLKTKFKTNFRIFFIPFSTHSHFLPLMSHFWWGIADNVERFAFIHRSMLEKIDQKSLRSLSFSPQPSIMLGSKRCNENAIILFLLSFYIISLIIFPSDCRICDLVDSINCPIDIEGLLNHALTLQINK